MRCTFQLPIRPARRFNFRLLFTLEDFDPANTWFGHKKARYHHMVYIAIHMNQLEFQAIDQQGRLFDSIMLKKRGTHSK